MARFSATYRLQPITTVKPGDNIYVDLRVLMGPDEFDKINLPNAYFTRYVCSCTYVRWIGNTHRLIEAECPLLNAKLNNWSSLEVYMHGSNAVFDPATMVMVTEALCVQYPTILPTHTRRKLYRLYKSKLPGGEGAVL